ncbi:MAG TPA: hypothetical protein VMU50_13005 [Polyangia bacterium]|nr:hypothetical protein [Polyangia bacterium]
MATARTTVAAALAPLVGACAMLFVSGCGSSGSAGNSPGSASGGNGGGTGGAMSGGATGGASVGTGGTSGGGSGGEGGSVAGTGGTPSSTSPDGSASDAPAPGGPCTALFCESFEAVPAGSPPDPAIWTRTPDAMKNVVVDTTTGALGTTKALHVPSEVNGFYYIREKKSVPAMGTKFYERVWFRIDRRPIEKPNGLFHWTLFTLDELDDFQAGKLLRFGGHVEASNTIWPSFNFQAHGNPGETRISDPMYTFDLKKWYCIEAYFSLPDQEARFWINGVEDPLLHWCKTCAMPTATPGYTFPQSISYMDFGWAISHGLTTDWEVWVDEIAIDTKKIGCGTSVF